MALTFDISQTPFSRYGSYYAISHLSRKGLPLGDGVYIRTVHGQGVARSELFRLEWADGALVTPAEVTATPSQLLLTHKGGTTTSICISAPETLRIFGRGPGLSLTMQPAPGVIAHPDEHGRWVINAAPSYRRYMFEPIVGALQVDVLSMADERGRRIHDRLAMHLLPNAEGLLDVAIDEFGSAWEPRERPAFEVCVSAAEADFEAWLASMPPTAPALQLTQQHAAYVTWSSVVAPSGLFARPAMLMSKNHMCQVWSWDNCFNAMALSYSHPQLAWDQLMLIADHQDELGAFPDSVNDYVKQYNFSKPPVHGWALRFMRQRNPAFFTRDRLQEIYEPFARWANWWLTYRVAGGERLPHYLHGNDSGWDNSTIFDQGVPLIAPDLSALLALHCAELADVAYAVGDMKAALKWREVSNRLVSQMVTELWRDDAFIGTRQFDHLLVPTNSLIALIPVVAGERLPRPVQQALVARVNAFTTEFGLATERPDSPQYLADGYWRGPIWAPSTLLIAFGLSDLGKKPMARQISERFCRLCAQSGFAENFDALTGQGLRDPAYTWTASVFTILAHEFMG